MKHLALSRPLRCTTLGLLLLSGGAQAADITGLEVYNLQRSDLCLQSQAATPVAGAGVQAGLCHGGLASQNLVVVPNANGSYQLKLGGYCLGATANPVVSGTTLQLQACNGSTLQSIYIDGNTGRFIPAAALSLVLDLHGGNFTDVRFWTDGGGANQRWSLRPRSQASNSSVSSDGTWQTVTTAGWAAWSKRLAPVFSGPYAAVGDPSVMRVGSELRMTYNCYDIVRQRGAICLARSTDGLSWSDVNTGDTTLPSRLIATRPGQWDDAHESAAMVKFKNEYLLYYVGYLDRGGFFASFPAEVGLATSSDGIHFTRANGGKPVLKTSPAGYDNDAISSPSFVVYNNELVMLYSAYCFYNCPKGAGVTLLAATSKDGRTWTKRSTPVLTAADFPGVKDGIAEVDITQGPDGRYYLFHTRLNGEAGHEIGVAQASSPFGPWTINPEPIVRKSATGFDNIGPIAPSVVFENGKARMWFHGFATNRTAQIGYAEATLPMLRP